MKVWEQFTNEKQWEQYLKNLLKVNNRALKKAIVCIYNNQTNEEKFKGESTEDNCLGFSKIDAKDLSTLAEKIKRGDYISVAELALARNKMPKYWRQLMVLSKKKSEAIQKAKAEAELAEEKKQKELQEIFEQQNEAFRKCLEEGKSCDYGICDECPIGKKYVKQDEVK